MPTQVRIISQRNSAKWDNLVHDLLQAAGFGKEHTYFGCINQDRADRVRRGIRTAARRQGIGAKVFWKECPDAGQCKSGGPECTHHVYATFYDHADAVKYKAAVAKQLASSRR